MTTLPDGALFTIEAKLVEHDAESKRLLTHIRHALNRANTYRVMTIMYNGDFQIPFEEASDKVASAIEAQRECETKVLRPAYIAFAKYLIAHKYVILEPMTEDETRLFNIGEIYYQKLMYAPITIG